eukprot:Clim_evm11s209 gene=Clim_evmTU11s209
MNLSAFLVVSLATVVTLAAAQFKSYTRPVFGFVPGWYGTSGLDAVDFEQLTHAAFAFALPQSDGSLNHPYDHLVGDFVNRCHSFGVRAILSIGGALGAGAFHSVGSSTAARATFSNAVASYVTQHNFDGVDIDWEEWSTGGNAASVADETAAYLALMEDVKAALPEEIILTTDVFGSNWFGQNYPTEMFSIVDFVNIMAYDFTGNWGGSPIAHHSTFQDAQIALSYWQGTRGVPASKINLGVPFYGKSFPGGTHVPFSQVYCPNRPALDSLDVDNPEYGTNQFTETPQLITKKLTDPANVARFNGVMIWEVTLDVHPNSNESLLGAVNAGTNKYPSSYPVADACAAKQLPATPVSPPTSSSSSTTTTTNPSESTSSTTTTPTTSSTSTNPSTSTTSTTSTPTSTPTSTATTTGSAEPQVKSFSDDPYVEGTATVGWASSTGYGIRLALDAKQTIPQGWNLEIKLPAGHTINADDMYNAAVVQHRSGENVWVLGTPGGWYLSFTQGQTFTMGWNGSKDANSDVSNVLDLSMVVPSEESTVTTQTTTDPTTTTPSTSDPPTTSSTTNPPTTTSTSNPPTTTLTSTSSSPTVGPTTSGDTSTPDADTLVVEDHSVKLTAKITWGNSATYGMTLEVQAKLDVPEGWAIGLKFPNGQDIGTHWNFAIKEQLPDGTYILVTPGTWNTSLAAGGTFRFGWNGKSANSGGPELPEFLVYSPNGSFS